MTDATDHPLERLVFFSDAVFAIAITLLVIEVHVPDVVTTSGDRGYWIALAHMAPNLTGYFVSFGVIGAFWMGHHRAFSLASRFSQQVVGWNLLLLGCIAFMPFVTAFMNRYMGARVPAMIYWGWLLLTALLNLRVNTIATSPSMRASSTSDEDAAYIRWRGVATICSTITALVVTQFAAALAPLAMLSLPLWRRVLYRRKASLPAD